jgi:hypothetical protein
MTGTDVPEAIQDLFVGQDVIGLNQHRGDGGRGWLGAHADKATGFRLQASIT